MCLNDTYMFHMCIKNVCVYYQFMEANILFLVSLNQRTLSRFGTDLHLG